MPHLLCALGLLVSTAGSHWSSISENVVHSANTVTRSLQETRVRLERAILAPQVSSVDLLIVAIADEAVEELRFAAPDRWRKTSGQAALSDAELKIVRARLGQIAAAGHAAALGQFEIVLRPGEQLGLSTHRPVRIAQASASGGIDVHEAFVSTLPILKLDRLDLFGQQLALTVQMSIRPRTGGENFAMSSFRMDRLQVRAGEALMVIAKNPFPIDRHAAEQEGSDSLPLDNQHRLLLITPGRQLRPKANGQIARDRGIPQLAK